MFVFYFHAFVFHALRLIVAFLLNRALALPQPLSHPRLITVQLLQQPCLSLYLPAFSRVPFFLFIYFRFGALPYPDSGMEQDAMVGFLLLGGLPVR